ncbi:MAG: Smr/MutS family protein [Rhodospirillaceae bacterium]|nr:Smr/MutS family protein [Rhodospirillaceae bacterium]
MTEAKPPRRKSRSLITPEDVRLWAQMTRHVTPLPHAVPIVVPDAEQDQEPPETPDLPNYPGPRLMPRIITPVPTGRRQSALTHGSTAGVDKRTAERFKKGDMEIESRLDLHGMTRDAAHDVLHRFICSSVAARRRLVLVITGKGRQSDGEGILRAEVPRWLNEPGLRSLILSFTYAQPRHGGEGALYVFLKRERNK